MREILFSLPSRQLGCPLRSFPRGCHWPARSAQWSHGACSMLFSHRTGVSSEILCDCDPLLLPVAASDQTENSHFPVTSPSTTPPSNTPNQNTRSRRVLVPPRKSVLSLHEEGHVQGLLNSSVCGMSYVSEVRSRHQPQPHCEFPLSGTALHSQRM